MRTNEIQDLRRGLSLLEMLAVVTLMGVLAVIVIPRFTTHTLAAKRNACFVNKGNIEVQCQLWLRQKGVNPAANLNDIAADKNYFPEGLPKCPVDSSSYTITTSSLRVSGHTH